MRTMRAKYLIHGIVETGEVRRSDCSDVLEPRKELLRTVLERSMRLSQCGSTQPIGDDWSIKAQASLPGGHLAVRLYAPGMDPAGPCASSMCVTYNPGKPPLLWASRANVHLAPEPAKAATEVRDLEVGLAWAWIPLMEAWIAEDWTRTLAAQEYRMHDGWENDEDWPPYAEEEYVEPDDHYDAETDDYYDAETDAYYLQTYGGVPWEGCDDSPWDWAPVDIREDWSRAV